MANSSLLHCLSALRASDLSSFQCSPCARPSIPAPWRCAHCWSRVRRPEQLRHGHGRCGALLYERLHHQPSYQRRLLLPAAGLQSVVQQPSAQFIQRVSAARVLCLTLAVAPCMRMTLCPCLIDLSSSALPQSRTIRSSGFNVPDWPDLHFWPMLDGGNDSTLCPVHLRWRRANWHGVLL